MSSRQKFWVATILFLTAVAGIGGLIGHWVPGPEGTMLSIVFGLAAGTIGGALMPLDWHP